MPIVMLKWGQQQYHLSVANAMAMADSMLVQAMEAAFDRRLFSFFFAEELAGDPTMLEVEAEQLAGQRLMMFRQFTKQTEDAVIGKSHQPKKEIILGT